MKLPKLPKIGRSAVCILVVTAIFLVYVVRLVEWQIVRGEEFHQIALSNKTDTIELSAARGEILDKDGVVLAGNKTTYDLVYNALKMVYEERNATIVKVVALLEERGEKWVDRLPIELDEEGDYVFSENREDSIASLKETFDLAEYATAEDCMNALINEYNCSGYSREDTRIVASVRYNMTRSGYSRTNPYVIAQNVSPETVGVFSEREDEFKGIEPRVSVTRTYGEDGSLAPHILGDVGLLSPEDYEAAKENGTVYDSETNPSGYKWTGSKGKSGLEEAFESQLRGKRGRESILVDETGAVKSTTVTEAPEEGNTVHLALSADLQRVANLSLEENVKANTGAANCEAGAAVALDVKTFGVLACASYPTFDMNRYKADDSYVEQIGEDKTSPQYNRALDGSFTPGSVFKPMVALAALQEGVISASSTPYNCQGYYQYADLTLKCTGVHGYADVYEALSGSCNAFFCDTGMNLRIKKMDAYAEYFALGTKTGVELSESSGIMSSPQEYAENNPGFTWTDGLTAQTAIGQCDNMFTPIQLATYCATIANGGVRLRTHFLDKITNYTGDEVVEAYQPEQMSDAGLSSDVLGVVREGMRQVAADPNGTAYATFGDYPVAIAAKTGTAETANDEETDPNLTFIAYAPLDDPQIAVAVVMEKGKKGAYAQNVAKDILDQYFGFVTRDEDGNRFDSEGNQIDKDGKVLKTADEVAKEKEERENAEKMESEASQLPEKQQGTNSSASEESSSSKDRDEGIPDTPFTGESQPVLPESTMPPESSSGSRTESFPNSPYWGGP